MQKMVKTAERIARRAHAGQVDKAGVPYAHHPAWVAARVEGDDAKAAAWLHDVLEDTNLTADDLRRAGIPEEVVHTVEVLTHAEGESYQDYLERVARHPLEIVLIRLPFSMRKHLHCVHHFLGNARTTQIVCRQVGVFQHIMQPGCRFRVIPLNASRNPCRMMSVRHPCFVNLPRMGTARDSLRRFDHLLHACPFQGLAERTQVKQKRPPSK